MTTHMTPKNSLILAALASAAVAALGYLYRLPLTRNGRILVKAIEKRGDRTLYRLDVRDERGRVGWRYVSPGMFNNLKVGQFV